MNRYSFLFAAIVAATFVAPTPHGGESPHTPSAGKASQPHSTENASSNPYQIDPNPDIKEFLDKRTPQSVQQEIYPQVLFATVPHPIETHLAADFDENIAALQQAIQDSGYLFDASWIPWEFPIAYDRFNDNLTQKDASKFQDGFPGILTFRSRAAEEAAATNSTALAQLDPYARGLIVLLIAEKPTAGLETLQIDKALEILAQNKIPVTSPIRIAGPAYSGSLPSLGPSLLKLHQSFPQADFFIRSGVTGGEESKTTLARVSREMPNIHIDFGSANRNYPQWVELIRRRLSQMGLSADEVAFLSEDESSYGRMFQNAVEDESIKKGIVASSSSWQILYPRDISTLRAGYEKQGIFDDSTPAQPWKHFLNIKSDDQAEGGDSVRSFGGASTQAAQESILFGISQFLKLRRIRAVVISATNSEDSYFLSQFLHANNGGVRIINIGGSRLFMRGSTAQFRGDLVVDNFPMLPQLPDWISGGPDPDHPAAYIERVFSNGFSQGLYMDAIDLLAPESSQDIRYPWYLGYSTPVFKRQSSANPTQQPPMYITALGSDAAWPVDLGVFQSFEAHSAATKNSTTKSSGWNLEMPFALFRHVGGEQSAVPPEVTPPTGRFWILLFIIVYALIVAYCFCFLYAKPVSRRFCASMEPEPGWRYWLFTVTIPGLIAGGAFQAMAGPLRPLSHVSANIVLWYWLAMGSSIAAPLAIASAALYKANYAPPAEPGKPPNPPPDPLWHRSKTIALATPFFLLLVALLRGDVFFKGIPDPGTLLDAYREMHWESGLSLIPSWLLIYTALFLWTRQASYASALMGAMPHLPTSSADLRISAASGRELGELGLPMPPVSKARSLYIFWLAAGILIFLIVWLLPSFQAVTTLEDHLTTRRLLYTIAAVTALISLDVLHFLWVWEAVHILLRALDTQPFRRTFVLINEFKWPSIWSFGGVSLYDQRAVLSAQIDCLTELDGNPEIDKVRTTIDELKKIRVHYRTQKLSAIPVARYRENLETVFSQLALIGTTISAGIDSPDYPGPRKLTVRAESIRRAITTDRKEESRFGGEAEEAARLLDWQQASERYVCLVYIAFIQTVIARLHRLMVSIAANFSIIAVAIAIYPFSPLTPFFLGGITLLPLIAWAFFHVFSQMDTDPILARIVNGDDRKLEWNFYGKFAESLALPVITLVSSLLPGGTGRILDVIRTLLNHSQ